MTSRSLAVICAAALFAAAPATASTIYLDGVSPTLVPGTFDLGAHLANYIGPSVEEGNGTALDGQRVYIEDVNDHAGVTGPSAQNNFHLLVWQFGEPKDSVRLYTHQDHYFGGPINDLFTASEVLEYSVWGCNSGGSTVDPCKSQADWTLLSDPNAVTSFASGKPIYGFGGTPAAVIYRGGSSEFGLVNAYVQDFTFASPYDFYAIRGSTLAMQADTADPELDAMVAFNRSDVPLPTPEPGTLMLIGIGMTALWRRSRAR